MQRGVACCGAGWQDPPSSKDIKVRVLSASQAFVCCKLYTTLSAARMGRGLPKGKVALNAHVYYAHTQLVRGKGSGGRGGARGRRAVCGRGGVQKAVEVFGGGAGTLDVDQFVEFARTLVQVYTPYPLLRMVLTTRPRSSARPAFGWEQRQGSIVLSDLVYDFKSRSATSLAV